MNRTIALIFILLFIVPSVLGQLAFNLDFEKNVSRKDGQFEMEICYESIYQDRWLSTGLTAVESRCN